MALYFDVVGQSRLRYTRYTQIDRRPCTRHNIIIARNSNNEIYLPLSWERAAPKFDDFKFAATYQISRAKKNHWICAQSRAEFYQKYQDGTHLVHSQDRHNVRLFIAIFDQPDD